MQNSNVFLFAMKRFFYVAATIGFALMSTEEGVSQTTESVPEFEVSSTPNSGRSILVELNDALRKQLCVNARKLLSSDIDIVSSDTMLGKPFTVLVSLPRSNESALITQGGAATLVQALRIAVANLRPRLGAGFSNIESLKVDVVSNCSAVRYFDNRGVAALDRSLQGILLPDPQMVFLPEELVARKLINTKGSLLIGRVRRYLSEGIRGQIELAGIPGKAGNPFYAVELDSFYDDGGEAVERLYRGNVLNPVISPQSLLAAVVAAGNYLLRHQLKNGSFGYIYDSTTDRYSSRYNLLRHAGTCYALFELYQATKDVRYLRSGGLGLKALSKHLQSSPSTIVNGRFKAVVSADGGAKLGGAALAIIAMLKYQEVSDKDTWIPDVRALAEFLLFQQEKNGHFVSKFYYNETNRKPFDSMYYPGEAILALTRLYTVDPQEKWLKAAEKGASWLINVRDAGKPPANLPHDHWLVIALNELYLLSPKPIYSKHARDISLAIVAAQRRESRYPDWVGSFYSPPRSTPTAIRSEALVAMTAFAERLGSNTLAFIDALKLMAAFQLRCQATKENILYLPRPDRAIGGFRHSLTDWNIRIDYVQHNISSLLGLRGILLKNE